ncbi:hypothetical protein CALCODRAFT_513295 [Calocera cornea HHB12733]|uniref:Uncharacterized protein n=1 Tax=Calocera cornea HHB12733 TaxID=1353952 RepID=A0A165C8Z0_9BASI|nr:hypothetical protein CALCODRAFT_513295 [Calocera cornea HHB12733]
MEAATGETEAMGPGVESNSKCHGRLTESSRERHDREMGDQWHGKRSMILSGWRTDCRVGRDAIGREWVERRQNHVSPSVDGDTSIMKTIGEPRKPTVGNDAGRWKHKHTDAVVPRPGLETDPVTGGKRRWPGRGQRATGGTGCGPNASGVAGKVAVIGLFLIDLRENAETVASGAHKVDARGSSSGGEGGRVGRTDWRAAKTPDSGKRIVG